MEENGNAPLTWEGKRSAAAAPDAEVVDKPTRRRFSPLEKELEKARLIIDVQGKVAGLLGLSLEDGTNS